MKDGIRPVRPPRHQPMLDREVVQIIRMSGEIRIAA